MIFASSSGDHFDCFFAGDSEEASSVVLAGRLAGITEEEEVNAVLEDSATLEGAESDRANDRGEVGFCDDSSSFGSRSREISTVEEWCQDWPQGWEDVGRIG